MQKEGNLHCFSLLEVWSSFWALGICIAWSEASKQASKRFCYSKVSKVRKESVMFIKLSEI